MEKPIAEGDTVTVFDPIYTDDRTDESMTPEQGIVTEVYGHGCLVRVAINSSPLFFYHSEITQ